MLSRVRVAGLVHCRGQSGDAWGVPLLLTCSALMLSSIIWNSAGCAASTAAGIDKQHTSSANAAMQGAARIMVQECAEPNDAREFLLPALPDCSSGFDQNKIYRLYIRL